MAEEMKSDKEIILEKTNGGLDVFRYYLPEFIEEGKAFLSPLRSEKNPSANIFRADAGVYLFKDFGIGKALNCIDFIMEKDKLDYKSAVAQIKKVLNLEKQVVTTLELEISGSPIEYFNDYCPVERIGQYLERYNIYNIESYNNKGKTYTAASDQPIIGFKIADNCYKLYQPEKESVKHMWLGAENKPADYKNIWGLDQLPEHCDTILITEGLKDAFVANVNLNHHDVYAVAVDNVSIKLPAEIIEALKTKCKNLLLCFDLDEPGMKNAQIRSAEHGLRYVTIPDALKDHDGKDISDWFRAGLGVELLEEAFRNAQVYHYGEESTSSSGTVDSSLRQMLEMEKTLKDRAKNTEKPEPLITFQGNPVIIKGTINAIIGKQGSHKSHLAGGFASLICSDKSSIEGGMGFEKPNSSPAHVVYIDTERNTRMEFPSAISAIQIQSGNENVEEYFHPVSVKEFSRDIRLDMIKLYVDYLRRETSDHLVVIIDVITDCVNNFNDVIETLDLFDYLGKLAEEKDITIIAVIHQNPGSDKARGHAGSELGNKCSTAMSIGYRTKGDLSKGTITVSYVKNRHSMRLPDLLLKFNEQAEMLTALSDGELKSLKADKQKAALGDVEAALLEIMTESGKQYAQQDVVSQLESIFDCSSNTVKKRLEAIEEKNDGKFEDEEGEVWSFEKSTGKGVKTYYTLSRIKEE